MMLSLLVAFVAALTLSLVLTPGIRLLALRCGVVAPPREDRWHRHPTPLLGGVAILLAFSLPALALGRAFEFWPPVGVAGYMFAVGVIDDIRGISPPTKFALQLAGATALAAFGWRLQIFEFHVLDLLLTVLWVIAITNAFNLLDNMDGLAAGIGLLAGLALLALGLREGTTTTSVLLAGFCGALAGFLVYNFNPASVFMGDSGSLFIGSLLAGLSLVESQRLSSPLVSILAGPALILLVPIADTTFVAISRTLTGRRIWLGGRDHTSHRLVAIGLSERRAVLLLYAIAAAGGVLALSMPYVGSAATAFALTVYLLGVVLLLVYLGAVTVHSGADVPRGHVPLLLELTYRRRLFEVLLDFGLAAVSYYTAYLLRFEGEHFKAYFPVFLSSLPIVLVSRVVALLAVGAYRGVWRYISIADLPTFVQAVALGSAGSIVLAVYFFRFQDFSRGVFIIDGVLFTLLILGSRMSFRLLADYVARQKRVGRRIVVYGAGDGGVLVVRELLNNERLGLRPVGFIDDDPSKEGRRVLGLPVLGGRARLQGLLWAGEIDEVVVSTDKIPADELQAIADLCGRFHVPVARARLAFERVGTRTAGR